MFAVSEMLVEVCRFFFLIVFISKEKTCIAQLVMCSFVIEECERMCLFVLKELCWNCSFCATFFVLFLTLIFIGLKSLFIFFEFFLFLFLLFFHVSGVCVCWKMQTKVSCVWLWHVGCLAFLFFFYGQIRDWWKWIGYFKIKHWHKFKCFSFFVR